jgi:hypothetical protein
MLLKDHPVHHHPQNRSRSLAHQSCANFVRNFTIGRTASPSCWSCSESTEAPICEDLIHRSAIASYKPCVSNIAKVLGEWGVTLGVS